MHATSAVISAASISLRSSEDRIYDSLLKRIRNRKSGKSAISETVDYLLAWINTPVSASISSQFSEAGWRQFEEQLSDLLAIETGTDPYDARPRIVSAQLTLLCRLTMSKDIKEYVGSEGAGSALARHISWIKTAASIVNNGVGDFP